MSLGANDWLTPQELTRRTVRDKRVGQSSAVAHSRTLSFDEPWSHNETTLHVQGARLTTLHSISWKQAEVGNSNAYPLFEGLCGWSYLGKRHLSIRFGNDDQTRKNFQCNNSCIQTALSAVGLSADTGSSCF